MVLTRDAQTPNGSAVSRLTFYGISGGGFRWRGQTIAGDSIATGWTSDCRRAE